MKVTLSEKELIIEKVEVDRNGVISDDEFNDDIEAALLSLGTGMFTVTFRKES